MKILFFLLFSACFLSSPLFFKSDFKPPPVHAHIAANPSWNVPPPSDEILAILNQPFFYFSHGNQSTVFESQDQKYVLKLFKYKRSIFPILHKIKNFFKTKKKQNFRTKTHKTFNAAHLAYSEASQFTQVLYAHLNLSEDLLPTVELKVKKRTYQLALDRTRFALQRKVAPFKKTLLSAKDDPKKMRELITSFVTLLEKRSELNIRNSDPTLGPNFGFLEGEAVELDFGNYQKIQGEEETQKNEILNFLTRLEIWLRENAPEHIDYVKDLRKKIAFAYDPKE